MWRYRSLKRLLRENTQKMEELMAKVDEWNEKWDEFMDSVRALLAMAKQADVEEKDALDEAMRDLDSGAKEVSDFVRDNLTSGARSDKT
jgi:ABC-type transporter Mla subunit MlaD